NPAHDARATRPHVMSRRIRNQFRSEMDLAHREVFTGADMTLTAGLLQIRRADHRALIGRRQNVMHAVTARTIRHDFRSELRSQSVITVLVAADAAAGHAELFGQRHAFMTLRATVR